MSKDAKLYMDLVEFAYEEARGSPSWLGELGTILSQAVSGVVSCFAFEVFRTDDRVNLGARWFEDDAIDRNMVKFFSEAPGDLLDVFHREPLVARTAGEVLRDAGLRIEGTILPDVFGAMGITELLAVPAVGPSGRGSVLGMCLDNLQGPPPEQRTMLAQLGAHIAAGARLHDWLDGRPVIEQAAAILQPSGKLEHARDGVAQSRDLLAEAVRKVERARRRDTDAEQALALWQGLVDGRWTLVEHFEGSGRRYYAAVENPPEIAKFRALTPREAQVVAYLASGTPADEAAYALGLSVITVRGHLNTAMAKLGVRDRAQLIGLRAALLGGGRKRDLDSTG